MPEENQLQKYKDIWYMHIPSRNTWVLSKKNDGELVVGTFDANEFRIDQAMDVFYKMNRYPRVGETTVQSNKSGVSIYSITNHGK